ncbi:outer membrane efflux protein [Prevotella sp. oral taxon 306 str. F0472]|uniref:TolC family protein n=1 Tax=Prevotella sp. oral taxon 306 TaxID=712461 RepID=UPI00025BA0FA|nr:TolC family protein [Prevotella sp. oral taxon 306]EID33601.1 outer membrane efflux protein [Prevotella sp. oral taxon 306 str. F0472]
MKKKILILALLASASVAQAQTLDECQRAAEKHYPIIKRYDLIAKTTDLTVKNIQKGWLPQVTAAAQATYQSAVAAWPDHLQSMFQQVGLKMKGLRKDQYKLSIDVQQPIYDGGVISGQRKIASQEGKVQEAENEVNLYQVRRRVNELYFSLLLLDEQIKLNDDVKALLQSSEQKLSAMVKGGTAATSDYENVRAERLSAEQANESLKAQKEMLSRMLSLFCGIEITHLQKPKALDAVVSTNTRPEIRLFDNQLRLSETQEKALDARLKPHLGLFAQGYYGYPGLNMFEDMMQHKWSLNGLVGVKLSWNIGALYTHKNDKARLRLQREQIENAREVFLFNNSIDEIQQKENVNRYRKMMQNDDEIIDLRTHIRKAAESKLAHGIIDVNSLLREINNENAAKAQQAIHEIDMLKEMYNLKFTNNE